MVARKLKGFGKTPVSNTGVNLTDSPTAGLDWLSGSFPESQFNNVKTLAEELFHDCFTDLNKATGFYQRTYKSANGILLCSTPFDGGVARNDAFISFSGSVLNRLQSDRQSHLFIGLQELGFRCSRLDLKIDDYQRIVKLEAVEKAIDDRNVIGFQTYRKLESGKFAGGNRPGKTVEFGKRGKNGSGKFLRIYDKGIESDGKIDAVRIELELSGQRSRDAFEMFVQSPVELWASFIGGYIRGSIGFVDRKQSTRADRCEELEWWKLLLSNFERLSLAVTRVKSSIEKVKGWLHSQVAPSLALILRYTDEKGLDFNSLLWQILEHGEERLKSHHFAILAAAT